MAYVNVRTGRLAGYGDQYYDDPGLGNIFGDIASGLGKAVGAGVGFVASGGNPAGAAAGFQAASALIGGGGGEPVPSTPTYPTTTYPPRTTTLAESILASVRNLFPGMGAPARPVTVTTPSGIPVTVPAAQAPSMFSDPKTLLVLAAVGLGAVVVLSGRRR